MISLAGKQATNVRLHIPAWGVWFVEVSLDAEATITGAVTQVVADLTLKGTVLAGGPDGSGRSHYRIIGGKGGLGRTLPKKAYANDAGVKLSTVLADALRDAGEELAPLTTAQSAVRLGPSWTRPAGPACRLLEQVAPSAWYVANDGKVTLGARPATAYTGNAVRVSPVDRAHRSLTLAAEVLAPLVPGVVVDGLTAIDVVHTASAAEGLRTTIYGRGVSTTSAVLDSFRKILEQLDPFRAYRGVVEYRVVAQQGNRLDLQCVLASVGMPDLQRVPVRPGFAGAKFTLTPGARVLVAWVNADPARPVVVGFEDADSDGWAPTLTTIDATTIKLGASASRNIGAHGDTAEPTIVATQSKVQVP